MADDNSPNQRESRPPEKAVGSSGFRLLHREGQAGFDTHYPARAGSRFHAGHVGAVADGFGVCALRKILAGRGRPDSDHWGKGAGRPAGRKQMAAAPGRAVGEGALRAGLAQPMAFILVLVSLYISNSLIMHDHDAAGIALGTTTIGAILAAFLGARYIQPKDEKKDGDISAPGK